MKKISLSLALLFGTLSLICGILFCALCAATLIEKGKSVTEAAKEKLREFVLAHC